MVVNVSDYTGIAVQFTGIAVVFCETNQGKEPSSEAGTKFVGIAFVPVHRS